MQRRSFIKLIALSSLLPAMPVMAMSKSDALLSSEAKPEHKGLSEDYLKKMRHPDDIHRDDVSAALEERRMVEQLSVRLEGVQKFVGYRNFSVLSFDRMLRFGRRYSEIGPFDNVETDFLEKIFYEDALQYGFYGDKPLTKITQSVKKRSIVKVPYTGQYLFKGKSLKLYTKLKQDIGDNITLTSGVRSVVKQMHLFLRKASQNEGNLSLASRSLAPPGYSFHGVGDFDVGHVDLGAQNFTEAFAKTDEFKKLIDLGYINIRYLKDNELGVRFEPWHIKVL